MPRLRPDRTLDRFDADPTKSFTLAASYYTDPDVFAREQTAIFHRTWQYVGPASRVREPGRYVTAEIAGQRVFVLRNSGGDLAAFFNVCLHRGHALLEGSGTIGRLITCPYHAWAYNPDGTLQGARMADRMEEFDETDFRLPEVAVEEFGGFVFVNLDPDPLSMSETYPGAEAEIRKFLPDEPLLEADVSLFDIKGNWKNVGDNLLECYHCHPAHRAFVDLIDMDTYRNNTFENWSYQSGACNPNNDVYAVPPGEGSAGFASVFLYPNISIGTFPGLRGALTFHFVPTEAELTRQEFAFHTPDGELTPTEVEAWNYFNDVLGPEDVALVENVQVGLRSLGYHQGRFICIPDRPEISEHGVHHFHSMVLRDLADH